MRKQVGNQYQNPTEECRTRYLGRLFDLHECLVEAPGQCPFALGFGDVVLCGHPLGGKFEARAPMTDASAIEAGHPPKRAGTV
jgi:hypothetical protein